MIIAFTVPALTGCDNDRDRDKDDRTLQEDRIDTERERQLSPAEERRETLSDLQRMRSRLIDELEAVRARLNDGALTPDARAKNSARAAELGQGLERLDRAILEVNEANDTTWPALRTRSRTGADDFREWMRQQDIKDRS